jgi:anti-sigma regulatory factor (Ser/Thr protein kinase)
LIAGAVIRIGNRLRETRRALDLVERFGRRHRLSPHLVDELGLSLDELLSNTIAYGYVDRRRRRIELRLALCGGVLRAELRDDARRFDPRPVRAAPTGDLRQRRIGGVGLHFVRGLVDRIDYKRVAGQNRVQLAKRVRPAWRRGNG